MANSLMALRYFCLVFLTLSIECFAKTILCDGALRRINRPGHNLPPIPINPIVADCLAAANLMPTGDLVEYFGGTVNQWALPDSARLGKKLPALFRHGSCMVQAWRNMYKRPMTGPFRGPSRLDQRTGPVRAASAMHFQVWPALKESALQVTQQCIAPPRALRRGMSTEEIILEGQSWTFKVRVMERTETNWAEYNIYDA
jgi:hypothetical protein